MGVCFSRDVSISIQGTVDVTLPNNGRRRGNERIEQTNQEVHSCRDRNRNRNSNQNDCRVRFCGHCGAPMSRHPGQCLNCGEFQ